VVESISAGLAHISIKEERDTVSTNGLICGLWTFETGLIAEESEIWTEEALGKCGSG
jgi:hypothetical protein